MLHQPFDGGGQQGDSHPAPQALEDGLGIIVPADDEDWTAVPVELPPHPGQEVADAGHDAFTVTVSGSVIEVTGVTTGRFLPFGAGPALGMGSGHQGQRESRGQKPGRRCPPRVAWLRTRWPGCFMPLGESEVKPEQCPGAPPSEEGRFPGHPRYCPPPPQSARAQPAGPASRWRGVMYA